MHNLSCENEFYLHVNENSFSCERLCTNTCFEKEVQDNSQMAYCFCRPIKSFQSEKVDIYVECLKHIACAIVLYQRTDNED